MYYIDLSIYVYTRAHCSEGGIMLKNCSVYSLVVSGTSLAKLSAHVGEHYFQNTAEPKRKDTGRPKCNVVHRKVCQHLLRTMCTRAEHIGGEVL